MRFILCTWFGEFCSCCSLMALPGPAWVLLNWICKELISSLYIDFFLLSRRTTVEIHIALPIREKSASTGWCGTVKIGLSDKHWIRANSHSDWYSKRNTYNTILNWNQVCDTHFVINWMSLLWEIVDFNQVGTMFSLTSNFKALSNDTEPGIVSIHNPPCRGRVSLGSINCFLSASLNTHPLRIERGEGEERRRRGPITSPNNDRTTKEGRSSDFVLNEQQRAEILSSRGFWSLVWNLCS